MQLAVDTIAPTRLRPRRHGAYHVPDREQVRPSFRGIVFNNYKNYNYKEKRYELAESP